MSLLVYDWQFNGKAVVRPQDFNMLVGQQLILFHKIVEPYSRLLDFAFVVEVPADIVADGYTLPVYGNSNVKLVVASPGDYALRHSL